MKCYLVCLCAGSSLDRDTNNFTLFQLVERLQLPVAAFPQLPFQRHPAPIELHIYVDTDPEELSRGAIEVWPVWVSSDGSKLTATPEGQLLPLQGRRARIRFQAILLPAIAGYYHLQVDWRWQGDDAWSRFTAEWPFEFEITPQLTFMPIQ
jgi:hypothetical protein